MPVMSNDEVAAFLDHPGVLLRIGTVDADGMPRVVPVWFRHDDGRIFFTPRAHSRFLVNIRRDPRVGLSIDEESRPYRKLTIGGRAEIVHDLGEDDGWRDTYRDIAMRYIEPDNAEAYIQATIDQPRALLAVRLADSVVSTWRMPVTGETGTGIWARRYYLDDTIMARRAGEQR